MKLIILDRDGVINYDSDHYIKHPSEWLAIPGSLSAMAKLYQAGFHIVVCTNQSGIARGHYSTETLHAIHQKMHQQLAELGGQISHIEFCPHHPDEHCHCRKPEVGMLENIARRFQCHLKQVPFVGDSLRDLQAGATMGCQPILLKSGNGQALVDSQQTLPAGTHIFNNLADFVETYLTGDMP